MLLADQAASSSTEKDGAQMVHQNLTSSATGLTEVAKQLNASTEDVKGLLHDTLLPFAAPADPYTHCFSAQEVEELTNLLLVRQRPEWARLPDYISFAERDEIEAEFEHILHRGFTDDISERKSR